MPLISMDEVSPKARSSPRRGSHLPVLMKLFGMTDGPIAELGCGMYSTPYLHWACYPTYRRLVTFEAQSQWLPFIAQFQDDNYHQVVPVTDWVQTSLAEPWSIAFVDHANPDDRKRCEEVARLTHAEYVVCHDAENKSDHEYKYSRIRKLFKYRWKYTVAFPFTSVLSNVHDLTGFTIP